MYVYRYILTLNLILGLHHQGIFRVSGSQVEINNFREWFERGEDPLADMTDASDINSVAGVFKLYLRELREPLFPIIYFEQFMELARKQHFFLILVVLFRKICKRLLKQNIVLLQIFRNYSCTSFNQLISNSYFRTRKQKRVYKQDEGSRKKLTTASDDCFKISFCIFKPPIRICG